MTGYYVNCHVELAWCGEAKVEYRKFDELLVGETFLSAGLTLTEHHVVSFAGLTGDFHPMHMDESVASESRFGKRIAHGMLVMGICNGLVNQTDRFHALAFLGLEWNMLKPVFVGDTVRARSTLVSKQLTSSGRHGVVGHSRQVINQRDELVQDGMTRILVEV
ncbi:MAG: MaoC/PaaZ C-terminal domain-containing protein [Rhizobiaceae bacterium]